MAFNTYKCEQFIIYVRQHNKHISDIYDLIINAPFTTTQLGKQLGLNYFAIARKLKLKNLSEQETISLLEFIK